MALFQGKERAIAEALAALTGVNPFLPERMAHEQAVLGDVFQATHAVWSVDAGLDGLNPNLSRLEQAAVAQLESLRKRLAAGAEAGADELALYEELVLYVLYARTADAWRTLMDRDAAGRPRPVDAYARFREDALHFLSLPQLPASPQRDPAFLFAYGYQTRRAFHHVFRQLYGGSLPAAELRAEVWQSIFTRDRARYRRALVGRMQDVTTLIVGPSGTGKELVARAIGLSRFIPFDAEAGVFAEVPERSFFPVNLSALSPTLIESELFGHRKGAFTGAVEDRQGWLEAGGAGGTVFMDEIGELDPAIQVKLLRVLQTRSFQRLGETRDRHFEGKIVAATNRDLAREMGSGGFREDLYYRLCADTIRTPTLREQLADRPEDLDDLVLVIARRLFGAEGDAIAADVVDWVDGRLGRDYAWPGNVRELEQCVRNVVVRGTYHPAQDGISQLATGPAAELAQQVAGGTLGTEDLLARYTAIVYHRSGSYEEAARQLGIDRRTVKARLDRDFLDRLRNAD